MTSPALQFLPGDPDPLYSWEGQGNSLVTAILFPCRYFNKQEMKSLFIA